jgi:hypothetical protein
LRWKSLTLYLRIDVLEKGFSVRALLFNYKFVTFLRQNMAKVVLKLVTEVGTARDLLLSPVR